MRPIDRLSLTLPLMTSATIGLATPGAEAGWPFHGRPRPAVETVMTSRPQDQVAPSPMLGSFTPSRYVMVRGNGVVGGGYSALGAYGREQSLSVYGPLSDFRSTIAPIRTVTRGYDGVPVVTEGFSFSNPNLPSLSPVVYPTRATNASAFRFQTTPPEWDRAIMWIDQN